MAENVVIKINHKEYNVDVSKTLDTDPPRYKGITADGHVKFFTPLMVQRYSNNLNNFFGLLNYIKQLEQKIKNIEQPNLEPISLKLKKLDSDIINMYFALILNFAFLFALSVMFFRKG